MGRLLSIDYGRKRCGIAVTDPQQICANGLATVPSHKLTEFITAYVAKEEVEMIIVGEPRDMHGNPSESTRYITPGIARLRKALPEKIKIVAFDERFTSSLAHKAMIAGGLKKMARRDKALVDEMSATIILNDFLESRAYSSCHSID